MIAVLRTPARRISLAIALSLLVHAAILWLPYIQLPQAEVKLPPLSVRLEPLPEPAEKIARKTASARPEPMHPLTRSSGSVKPDTGVIAEMDRTEASTAAQPFPRHLQLSFIVYKGGSRTGEILQQLDIRGDRYNLKSVRKTSGLASLRNSDQLVQTSRGRIVEGGLQPEIFGQERITKSGKQSVQVAFDRTTQKIRYPDGSEGALPAETQDALSFLYQLSQVDMHGEFFTLPVSDGAQLQQYQIEIGAKEEISTPLGKLDTLHLRKMHTGGESYFDVWLGLEYRLLPVKFSEVDSSGNVTEEFDISGIRAADE